MQIGGNITSSIVGIVVGGNITAESEEEGCGVYVVGNITSSK